MVSGGLKQVKTTAPEFSYTHTELKGLGWNDEQEIKAERVLLWSPEDCSRKEHARASKVSKVKSDSAHRGRRKLSIFTSAGFILAFGSMCL